ncbi:MAG: TetR/AcrR family transcriptional regulator [Alphaproteobacteria bacterium]|nr:TetR/AcrR family transcriptional regulator [Alphaproteobacteria bacterium]
MARSGDETRKRILDAAERLFAERGFAGVTIRDITHAAKVDVALANYHFGPKEKLFEAVMMRRATLHMEERLARLERCIADAGGAPTLEAVLHAYADAFLERSLSGEEGWKHYFKLLAKLGLSPEWAPDLWSDYFDPFVKKLIEALRLALPGCPDDRLYWCYDFFSGILTHVFAETHRIDRLSGYLCRSDDLETAYPLMVSFVTAGCERIARGERVPAEAVRPRRLRVSATGE